MSREPISRSRDLKHLQDDGYEIEVKAGHLLVSHVPYVTTSKEVKYGVLVSTLALNEDITQKPDDHVAMFSGETPCDNEGRPLTKIINSSERRDLGNGIVIEHTFSSKPPEGYPDYYEKMATYINMLVGPAQAIDPKATATTFRVVEATEEESVFKYIDTASSRAGIGAINQRLEQSKVAIVGLGGQSARPRSLRGNEA